MNKFVEELSKWRELNKEYLQVVDLNKIDLTYKVHQRAGTVNLKGKIEEMINDENFDYTKIIVNEYSNGRYKLLFGLSELIRLKLLNIEKADVIVTELHRNELQRLVRNCVKDLY